MSPEMMSGHGYNQKTDSYSWAMVFYEMLSLQKPYAKFNRDMHKILVCQQQGRPHASNDIPWSARDLLKRSWCNDISDRPKMQEICDELEKMVDTVEQQTLPLIERSLRAVLEMAELFGFGNDKALTCIASGVIPCNNDDDSDIICSSYYCAENVTHVGLGPISILLEEVRLYCSRISVSYNLGAPLFFLRSLKCPF
jgi:serine/threonine protein kinase